MKRVQIVRVDADSVQKAELQIGSNIIGRGDATGCDDRRISRHAVTINLSPDGEMTITPVMPCYMKSVGSSGWNKLEVGITVPINIGDLFSLLEDKFWFKLVSVDETMENEEAGLKRKSDETTDEAPPEKKIRPDGSIEAILSPNDNLNDNPSSIEVNPVTEDLDTLDYDEEVLPVTDDLTCKDIYSASAAEGETRPLSPEATVDSQGISPSPTQSDNAVALSESRGALLNGDEDDIPDSEEAGKKIKWDCGRHFSDQSDQVITEEAAAPAEPATPGPGTTDEAPAAAIPDPVRRNRCTYGSRCYRQNTDHKSEFSHPGDADYDLPDNRPECRFGIRCYRKNPQHRKDFKHTIERRGRAQTPIRARTPETASGTDQSSVEESVDESEYEPSCCTDSSDDMKSDWDEK